MSRHPNRPSARTRGRARRRLRYLRQLRELQLRDLGGLVFDLYRFGVQREHLVRGKLHALIATDKEIHALRSLLDEDLADHALSVRAPGVGGTCSACGALHSSAARFCESCGAELAAPAPTPAVSPVAEDPQATQHFEVVPATAEPGQGWADDPATADAEPVSYEPVSETPFAKTPAAEPDAYEPVAETPVAETPVSDPPVAETPVADAPVLESPAPEAPLAEAPPAEEPPAEEPAAEAPEEPAVPEVPAFEEPPVDASPADGPDPTGEIAAVGPRRVQAGRPRRRRGSGR